MSNKYQLRYAAGKYWLLNMEQSGLDYKSPICLNEGAAYLWEIFEQGSTKEQIVEHLCREYGLSYDEAANDVEMFLKKLNEEGIIPG